MGRKKALILLEVCDHRNHEKRGGNPFDHKEGEPSSILEGLQEDGTHWGIGVSR